MAKPSNEIAKRLNRCTDLGKAQVLMGIAGVCETASQLNELMEDGFHGHSIVSFSRCDEKRVRELIMSLVSGFDGVVEDCTNSTINMAAAVLNHEDAPLRRPAVEFLRGEFLRIAQVAEGLARGLDGEKMPTA